MMKKEQKGPSDALPRHKEEPTLGDRLRAMREAANMTQAELARALNVSQQGIASWELGRTEPNLQAIRLIADYFHVSADSLLTSDIASIKQESTSALPEIQILQKNAKKMNPTQRNKMLTLLKLTFDEFEWDAEKDEE